MHSDPLAFEAQALEARCKSGARWFFWIAGLSMATSIVSFSGGGFSFFLSLGTTQVIDGFAKGLATELGDATRIVGLVLDALVAGVFVLIGWLALKRNLWAFVVGLILFMLDALILLFFQIWFGFAFHLLVTFWIFRGYQAGRALSGLEQEMQAARLSPPPPPEFTDSGDPNGAAEAAPDLVPNKILEPLV
jgi:hypothetical protein